MSAIRPAARLSGTPHALEIPRAPRVPTFAAETEQPVRAVRVVVETRAIGIERLLEGLPS